MDMNHKKKNKVLLNFVKLLKENKKNLIFIRFYSVYHELWV